MKQRAKLLIEFPEWKNVAELKMQLAKEGYIVESFAVLNILKGFIIPEDFMFEEEKDNGTAPKSMRS